MNNTDPDSKDFLRNRYIGAVNRVAIAHAVASGGPLQVEIQVSRDVRKPVLRPKSRGIKLENSGHELRFTLAGPGQRTIFQPQDNGRPIRTEDAEK
jgi:hypothetical protein